MSAQGKSIVCTSCDHINVWQVDALKPKVCRSCAMSLEPLNVGHYETLRSVFDDAYNQAAYGKGKDRHARGNPFEKQHMQSISHLLGTDRGMAFQAIKKLTEGLDMADPEARRNELLGAINYIAGIVVYHDIG